MEKIDSFDLVVILTDHSCYDYEKINAYIDNELSRDERNQFEVELNSDSNLQNEVNSIKNLLHERKEK